MEKKEDNKAYSSKCLAYAILAAFFALSAFCIFQFIPDSDSVDFSSYAVNTPQVIQDPVSDDVDISDYITDYVSDVNFQNLDKVKDKGLTLYRQSMSKSSVEWFYNKITGDKDITKAILTEAEKNDIPLSLAFALAYTESKYKVEAVGYNTNGTVDRGLFQLNSNSFPNLTEEEFFDPYTSAKYGMQHLKQCLRSAGNSVSALAMYNAGMGRVSSNKTPQTTLNYIGKIISYQNQLDDLFTDQVVIFYETQIVPLK